MGMTKEELLHASENLKHGDLVFSDIDVNIDIDVMGVNENGDKRPKTLSELKSSMGGCSRGVALAKACQELNIDPVQFISDAINEKLATHGYPVTDPELFHHDAGKDQAERSEQFWRETKEGREKFLAIPQENHGCTHTPPCGQRKQEILDLLDKLKNGEKPEVPPELAGFLAMGLLGALASR